MKYNVLIRPHYFHTESSEARSERASYDVDDFTYLVPHILKKFKEDNSDNDLAFIFSISLDGEDIYRDLRGTPTMFARDRRRYLNYVNDDNSKVILDNFKEELKTVLDIYGQERVDMIISKVKNELYDEGKHL